jgi:peptidoglycan hydrolase CwlO-like protein
VRVTVATKELVLHEGQLAEKIVTESYQPIELGSLQAEVDTHQQALDAILAEEASLAARKAEAEAALADSKSNVERGTAVVAQPTDTTPSEQTEGGASESPADEVAEPVTEF